MVDWEPFDDDIYECAPCCNQRTWVTFWSPQAPSIERGPWEYLHECECGAVLSYADWIGYEGNYGE